ncbi:hypothetical protein FO519_009233 [Halicephalobus sp. NKZ332]|nr:hypothetical protein FO519_009233 [Halicephalobus sp. NKZ332]
MKFILIFAIGITVTLAEGESKSDLITGCSSHCTLDFDKDLSCWNKTLNFYNHILVTQLRNYVATQISRANWSLNKNYNFNYSAAADATIAHMKSIAPGNIEDEDGLIKPADYESIVRSLMTNVQSETEKQFIQGKNQKDMTIECPIICEHGWDPFFWMFFISAGCNLFLGGVSMTLVWFLDRRDTRQAELELAECEVVKINPKFDETGIGALKRKSVHSLH